MLKVILKAWKRLKSQEEEIIAEEQAGFRSGRITTEHIFIICVRTTANTRKISTTSLLILKRRSTGCGMAHYGPRWRSTTWTRSWLTPSNRITQKPTVQYLCKAQRATVSTHHSGSARAASSHLPCSTSSLRIMISVLGEHHNSVRIGFPIITNLWFTVDIDGLVGEEQKLANLARRLYKTSTRYDIAISAAKTKLMTNSTKHIEKKITVSRQELDTVNQFKYLRALLSEEGSKIKVLARTAQTAAALAKLKPMRRDKKSVCPPSWNYCMHNSCRSSFVHARHKH